MNFLYRLPKSTFIISFGFILFILACGDRKKDAFQIYFNDTYSDSLVLAMSKGFNDPEVEKHTLYQLIAKAEKNKKIPYLDSLTHLYYKLRAYKQVELVGEKLLEVQAENLKILELVASAKKINKKYHESILLYEKLHNKSHNLKFAYNVVELNFLLKRYGEAQQLISVLLKNERSATTTINVNVTTRNRSQIPLLAGVYNIMGMIHVEFKEYKEAREAFQKSLEIAPNFELPINNIKHLLK